MVYSFISLYFDSYFLPNQVNKGAKKVPLFTLLGREYAFAGGCTKVLKIPKELSLWPPVKMSSFWRGQ